MRVAGDARAVAGMGRYPAERAARDRWVKSWRPEVARPQVGDVNSRFILEEEPDAVGHLARILTLFLTNRECPWRCVMCDLWRHTFEDNTPAGSIPEQFGRALADGRASDWLGESAVPRWVKLYNSGSFFDPRAVPPEDLPVMAKLASRFDRVIVESHPKLVGGKVLRFRDGIATHAESRSVPRLEVAMGLETAHPKVLEQLNKGFDLPDFEKAADFLRSAEIDLRVFLLVQPPFLDQDETRAWTSRSVAYALEQGASVVSLIPTRMGNGALEALKRQGSFVSPTLSMLEQCQEDALVLRSNGVRIFADTWNLAEFSTCAVCLEQRVRNIERMNRTQAPGERTNCSRCGNMYSPR